MNTWPSVHPRHLWALHSISAFNLRARFYFWARRGQGDPRPRGRSIEGPGCLPGPLRASLPKQHVGEGALGSAGGGVRLTPRFAVRVACRPPSNLGPQVGSPGRACDRGLAVARASSLWPGSRPAHASQPRGPRSGMQGSNLSRRQAAPSGACTHLEWDSATLGVSAPAPSPRTHVWNAGRRGVLSLVKYSRARSSIFLFYAFRVAVYF